MNYIIKYPLLFCAAGLLLTAAGCSKFLEEDVYTEYDPDALLKTEEGINSVLISAYGELQLRGQIRDFIFTYSEFPTDITLESGGGFEREAVVFMNYEWDPSHNFFSNTWSKMYRAIRNANSLIDNAGTITAIPADRLAGLVAEARFIRAAAYYHLYDLFGPVPLIATTETLDFEPSRPAENEFLEFLSSELRSAAADLPLQQELSGKATKGAALAVLCKLYLHIKDWEQCATVAAEIMALDQYSLFPEIENLFSVENEDNDEYIYVHPYLALADFGNVYMPHAFPPNYPVLPNWENYGAQFRTSTAFIRSFHPDDRRLRMFLTEYTDTRGNHIELVEDAEGNPLDNARSFKYTPDPAAIARFHGNDLPMIRYADILLSRAEALNELHGPTQEAIDLLNRIRERANVPLLQLAGFSNKETLRDHILQERNWEFFSEGKRRQDLVRHGKLIENALARGKNAQSHHVLFPIPQNEIEANPNLTQNEGY